jgi:hypothetical protein
MEMINLIDKNMTKNHRDNTTFIKLKFKMHFK